MMEVGDSAEPTMTRSSTITGGFVNGSAGALLVTVSGERERTAGESRALCSCLCPRSVRHWVWPSVIELSLGSVVSRVPQREGPLALTVLTDRFYRRLGDRLWWRPIASPRGASS